MNLAMRTNARHKTKAAIAAFICGERILEAFSSVGNELSRDEENVKVAITCSSLVYVALNLEEHQTCPCAPA